MHERLLFDHAQRPRHRHGVLAFSYTGHAANPLCADAFDIGVEITDGVITSAGFSGRGCALATGGASLLCERIVGLRVDALPEGFFHLGDEHIGRMREGCVTVSLTALRRALALYASR